MSLPKRKNLSLKVGAYLTKHQKSHLLNLLSNKRSRGILDFLRLTCEALAEDSSIEARSKESLRVFSELLLEHNRTRFIKKIHKSGRNTKIDIKLMHEINCVFNALMLVQKNLKEFNQTIDYKHSPKTQHHKALSAQVEPTLKKIKHCIKSLSTDCAESRKQALRILNSEEILGRSLESDLADTGNSNKPMKTINLINAALHLDSNPKLSGEDMEKIKISLGEDLFYFLANRYDLLEDPEHARNSLKTKKFTYNDLRMIIIGSLQHCKTDWWQNDFIKNLLLCLKYNHLTESNYRSSMESLTRKIERCSTIEKKQALASRLIENLKIPEKQIESLKETPSQSIINDALLYLKSKISDKWKFIIPISTKYNNNFARDFNNINSICEVGKWKVKSFKDHPPATMQRFSSSEFLFHKLSSSDCRDGSVIPIIEANGKKAFYKVRSLINHAGLHGFALVPINHDKSLEIKVVFKPKESLALEIIDTENYVQQQEFERHKQELLNNLNFVVSDFKHNLPENKKNNVRLNIGGYGSGGTSAQCLMHELIVNKATATLHGGNLENNNQTADLENFLQETLENNIEAQSTHELNMGRKVKNLDKHKRSMQQNLLNEFMKDKEKSILWLNPENQLKDINNFTLTTINSGGVSKKIRNKFIQSLYLLKKQYQNDSNNNFSINCDKMMSAGDPVQITGGTDLAAYVPKELMPITLMYFDNDEDGYKSYRKYLTNISTSSAEIVIQFIISKTTLLPAWVSSLTTSLLLNTSGSPGDKIAEDLKSLLSKAKNCHEKFHLNKPIEGCHILSNNNVDFNVALAEEKELNQMVAKKIPVFSCKAYQSIKKSIYDKFRHLKERVFTPENQDVIAFHRGNNPAQIFNKFTPNMSEQKRKTEAAPHLQKLEDLFKNTFAQH